jgi:hypothetical protein
LRKLQANFSLSLLNIINKIKNNITIGRKNKKLILPISLALKARKRKTSRFITDIRLYNGIFCRGIKKMDPLHIENNFDHASDRGHIRRFNHSNKNMLAGG